MTVTKQMSIGEVLSIDRSTAHIFMEFGWAVRTPPPNPSPTRAPPTGPTPTRWCKSSTSIFRRPEFRPATPPGRSERKNAGGHRAGGPFHGM